MLYCFAFSHVLETNTLQSIRRHYPTWLVPCYHHSTLSTVIGILVLTSSRRPRLSNFWIFYSFTQKSSTLKKTWRESRLWWSNCLLYSTKCVFYAVRSRAARVLLLPFFSMFRSVVFGDGNDQYSRRGSGGRETATTFATRARVAAAVCIYCMHLYLRACMHRHFLHIFLHTHTHTRASLGHVP